ncbi:MAG: cytochrome c [Armatimonadetes bacterium]|nr:cytochrome c [Armatimonadota bacterium]
MWVQPKYHHPYSETTLFTDGNSSRPTPDGTVAYGKPKTDEALYTGRTGGKLVTEIPAEIEIDGEKVNTRKDLRKILNWGQERFNAICSHCHGELGDGKGMIAQRGLALKRPPGNYHTDRLRKMPIGHFFDVMTNGYGIMYAQAPRTTVGDRWAIAAYIRALQMSQYMDQSKLTAEEKNEWDVAEKTQREANRELNKPQL